MIDATALREAARLIETAIERADLAAHDCESCGRQTFDDWHERQAHVELTAAARKLRAWADRLDAAAATA